MNIKETLETERLILRPITLNDTEAIQSWASNLENIFSLKTQNKVLWGAMAISLILTLIVIYIPPLAEVFSLAPLSVKELAVSFGLGLSVIPIIEAVKAVQRAIGQQLKTR